MSEPGWDEPQARVTSPENILRTICGVVAYNIAQVDKNGVSPVLDGYLNDMMLMWSSFPLYRLLGLSRAWSTALVVGEGFLSEVAQKYEVIPGTYDPNDFLAFAAGGALCYVVDAGIERLLSTSGEKTTSSLASKL